MLRTLLLLALVPLPEAPAAAQYGPSVARAEDSEPERPRRRWGGRSQEKPEGTEWQQIYTMDERTGKRLATALEHLHEERYDETLATLGKLRMKSLNPYERAQVLRVYAFAAYGKEDLAGARSYLEQAIAENALPPEDQASLRFNIAQMYLAEQNWDQVVASLEKWFESVENPNSSAYYLLALAHYQRNDLEAALAPARKAVELGDEPQESWLQLLLALRLLRQEYPEAVPILEQLVRRFPSKNYWLQLSTVYGVQGEYESALVPLQLAYRQGLLTEDSELRRLAQLLLFLELPYQAAMVLERGFEERKVASDAEAWEMLANSWIGAREYDRAVGPLTRAAKLSESGDLYVRLAQVHLQREKWSDAAEALRLALEKGDLENGADAQLLLGIAYYSQNQPERARGWFARALEHASTREQADAWLKHLEREQQASG